MNENHYQILGIPRDADEREIKRAYHRLARELHPDKQETPEKAREAEQKFALISTAYNLLKDPEARKEYDIKMFGGSVATGGAGPSAAAPPPPPQPSPPPPAPSASTSSSNLGAAGAQRTSPRTAAPQAQQGTAVKIGDTVDPKRAAIAQKAYVKAVQLLREKDPAKATEFFEAAIQNNPNEAVYYAKLSMALIEAKKSAARAIEAAEQAIELDKYKLEYKFNLASIYQAIGSKSNAIKVYEEILRWDKENKIALQMLRELSKTGGFLDKLSDASPLFGSLRKKFGK